MDKKEEIVIDNYIEEYLEGNRPTVITLSSAVPLNPNQKERILAAFKKKINSTENLEVIEIVDESLIGGVCLESDNFFFDNTIRNKLTQLKNYILEDK